MNHKLCFFNVLAREFFVGAPGINNHAHAGLINGFKSAQATGIFAAAAGRVTAQRIAVRKHSTALALQGAGNTTHANIKTIRRQIGIERQIGFSSAATRWHNRYLTVADGEAGGSWDKTVVPNDELLINPVYGDTINLSRTGKWLGHGARTPLICFMLTLAGTRCRMYPGLRKSNK